MTPVYLLAHFDFVAVDIRVAENSSFVNAAGPSRHGLLKSLPNEDDLRHSPATPPITSFV